MEITNKFFPALSEFEDHVEKLKFTGWTPNFIVVHNTSVPSQKLYKEWHDRKNWTPEQWGRNLASYYVGEGFPRCPHCFVGYDGVLNLNPLTMYGTHSPSWNRFTWGIETVAEFDNEPFNNGVRDNLVAVLAILHSRIGLNPGDFKLGIRGLHFHKEDKNTSHKNCPGKNLNKAQLVKDVLAYMNADTPKSHPHITEAAHIEDTSELTDEELIDPKWLQLVLNAKCNAGLKVDGKIGNLTKQAVKNFQQKMKLTVDGIAGPITRKTLKEFKNG